LVVDDDEELRRAITDMLLLDDHQVTTVADGSAALQCLRERHFDLMITDLGMPGMTGLQLCDHAGEFCPRLKAILITGIGAHLTEEDTANPLLVGVMFKPFRIKQLHRLLELVD
jgi:CheY-like chemotaxis protein